ncbi:hemolysin family protein [Melioribacteraceae bacterium 4301-Me]|uniref:hemolysin family protein n=1 Tax=Pyranulibacter aquaticus TaxID=3163344 RepID=UPI0035965B5C
MIYELLGLIVLILLSGFFSSSEMAFVLSNKIKIELRARKNNIAAKNALHFINYPQRFFSTILISNNVVNIAFASLLTVFMLKHFAVNDFEILIISTLLILIFGELIPKYLSRELPDNVFYVTSIPIRILSFLLFPLVKITTSITALIMGSEKMDKNEIVHLFDKDDFHELIEESSMMGQIEATDSEVISKIIDIREQRVYEAMTPRTEIVGVEIDSTIDEVLNKFIETNYTKLPVYKENLDNIKGLVVAYDMFKEPTDLKSIIRDVKFVPESKKSLEMLDEFIKEGFSFAVVVDEFGGTAGILTIEDIIEELFGEIRDEFDADEQPVRKISDNVYILSGKAEIDFINEEYKLNIPEGDYETIAGFITYHTGRIPTKGESITVDRFNFLILKSDKTKIELIKMSIIPTQ